MQSLYRKGLAAVSAVVAGIAIANHGFWFSNLALRREGVMRCLINTNLPSVVLGICQNGLVVVGGKLRALKRSSHLSRMASAMSKAPAWEQTCSDTTPQRGTETREFLSAGFFHPAVPGLWRYRRPACVPVAVIAS